MPFNDFAADESTEVIKLYMGESKIIPVKNPTRIAIGNPDIVDVVSVTNNELALAPKAAGATTLVFWDNFGEQSCKIKVFSENIGLIQQRVDSLLARLNLPKVYTRAEEDEAKVLLLGCVKNPQDRERISLVLNTLKDKVVDLITVKEEESVVEIDVQVLELSKDATKTLGFTNPLFSTVTLTETAGSPGISPGTYWTKLFRVVDMKRGAFTWTLDALVQEGKARILSRPRLACQSGKEAELLVGGEKPIFSTEVTSTGGSGTSVTYKEYGLKLKIKPTVSEDSRIKVSLNVDISEVGTVDSIGSSSSSTLGTTSSTTTAKAFPLTKRTAATELYLNDGQTLAIGGLIRHKQDENIEKTPGLGDIPILGALFRKKTTRTGGGSGERGDTELFITLTPTIIAKDNYYGQQPANTVVSPAEVEVKDSNAARVNSEGLMKYINTIQQSIVNNMNYPLSAKKAGFQGTTKLSLRLSSQGKLENILVKESSGYKILDENAITVAKSLVYYPPFPSSVDQEDIWVDIPIVYQLD